MRHKARKAQAAPQDDDLRAWVVIGLIFFGVTLAVFAPLVWASMHTAL